jgi:Mg2+ and Co2+ transporter CorA
MGKTRSAVDDALRHASSSPEIAQALSIRIIADHVDEIRQTINTGVNRILGVFTAASSIVVGAVILTALRLS